jgi:putative thiamine transport system permease protein
MTRDPAPAPLSGAFRAVWRWHFYAGLLVLPFLMLMALAILPQTDMTRRGQIAASLGYGRVMGFMLSTLPALYKGLRLPVFAVLAYGMTNVDMAMILGPTLPPSLAVQITDWMGAPSLQHLSTAAAGALVQLALVAATLAFWLGAERGLAPLIPVLAAAGQREAVAAGAGADVENRARRWIGSLVSDRPYAGVRRRFAGLRS